MEENSYIDKKSLTLFKESQSGWRNIAKDCVCFANAQGGKILIGIEDEESEPPKNQKIDDKIIDDLRKRIPTLTINVAISPIKKQSPNGGEFIELTVLRSSQAIASTTDGKYYIRVSDECKPIMPDEISRLVADKSAFIWETRTSKILLEHCDRDKLEEFVYDIKNSERVSDFVKQMSHEEIVEHYFLTDNRWFLTNLGILWIGKRRDRATLCYAPSVQFIKYDLEGKKVRKILWDDFSKNPKELISDIFKQIPDWNEFTEISEGIFRKNIYNYHPEVIREVIVNAFAHRNYTMRGDIFINLYHNHLEIHSPGLLPLGVTPHNILTKSVQRNHIIAKLFYDLRLMEKEGSGFDKIYEILLGDGKNVPEVIEGDDRVIVSVDKQIEDKKVLQLISKASSEMQLRQREIIVLGLIAQHQGVSATELTKILNIHKTNGLQNWMGRLLRLNLILSKGKTKGTFYHVNPVYLRNANFIEKTNLKRISSERLQELIYETLKNYPNLSVSEINKHIGEDIKPRKLKTKLDEMITKNLIKKEGVKRGTKYIINANPLNN